MPQVPNEPNDETKTFRAGTQDLQHHLVNENARLKQENKMLIDTNCAMSQFIARMMAIQSADYNRAKRSGK